MADSVAEIELNKIQPSRLNPRLEVNIGRLNELAESIKEVGLLEPIIVRRAGSGFEVVVGERRYRASQQAGLKRIPAIVRDYDDDEVVRLNLIENIQREELSAVEKGKVCKWLLENSPEKYPSQKMIAERIGVSPETVSVWTRTVEIIPQEVQALVASSDASGRVPEGKIDYETAVKVGRSIKEPEKKVEIIKKLAERKIPVRERTLVIEQLAKEPEKLVEEVIAEISESPYELRFSASDKESILRSEKSQTSRPTVPDPRVRAGAIVHAVVSEPCFANLRVVTVERKKLKYFNDEDAAREGCRSLKELMSEWKRTFGEWNENQLVYVIHFEKLM